MAENHALIPEVVAMYTQTDALKETKDLSQNLVSGDFERQYRTRVMEQGGRRKQACFITFTVAVGVIIIWLLALTVIREVQLTKVRQEVEQLSAHIVAVEANLNSLNNRISNNRLFNEFKTLEDTIYADDDQEEALKESEKDKQDYNSLEKLHRLTILEDDSEPDDSDDDDDLYDDSGDYYQDYDRRQANNKVGTSSMVFLDPKDFTDSLVKFSQDDKASLSKIRKMLNENPENPNIELIAAPLAKEALPLKADRDKRNASPELLDARNFDPKLEKRQQPKKFHQHVSPVNVNLRSNTRLPRESETTPKQFIAAHFHGNTSHLSPLIHEHYKGNGLVRVAHDAPHNVWYPAAWTSGAPHPRPTLTRTGHVHVHRSGIYLVYVQIYYLDSHDVISWVLHRTNAEIEGRDTLLQCAQSSHSSEISDRPNSCFSMAALHLNAGDRLAVRNTGGDRHSLMEPEKSFIGLIMMADAIDPFEEL